MSDAKATKEMVKEKYAQIAIQSEVEKPSCCCGSKNKIDYTVFNDDYSSLEGYVSEADMGLGCGLPTEFAEINKGDTVVDLGSGAGNDVFVARTIVGEEGTVIGIDMTPEMMIKAERNKAKLGFENVYFRLGEIEDLPVDDNTANVVISNCVLNLVPDKTKAFSEISRILMPGGRFCVSDIVLKGELPDNIRKAGEMYAGCVAGALQEEEYLSIIDKSGFTDIEVKKKKQIIIPDNVFAQYITEEELHDFKKREIGIFSITVTGLKPKQ